jgi:choline dehydrogenase-like flavoprotein
MLLDARDVASGAELRADVCVVGAGAAGITIAREFANGPHSVIVLESGALTFDFETQALYHGQQTGTLFTGVHGEVTLDAARLRFFGGTTNHWAGWCRPLEPVDFEATPARPDVSWPFGRETLDPWYVQAGRVCQLGPFEHEMPYWREQGIGEPLLETELVTTRMIQVAYLAKFGELYRRDLERARNVEVYLRANVLRFSTTPDGGAVTGAEVATLSGNRWRVNARVFVLATGGMEVPRVLLVSNEARPSGLGNENDLVGRHFMEHISIPAGFALLTRPRESLRIYAEGADFPVPPDRVAGRTFALKASQILTRDAMLRNATLNTEATFIFNDLGVHSEPFQESGLKVNDIVELAEAGTGARPATVAYVRLLGEQSPNPDSRIRLIRDKDALGVPQIELNWKPTRRDRDSMRRALAIFGAEFGRLGLGRIQVAVGGVTLDPTRADPRFFEAYEVVPADFDSKRFPLGIGFHHMGTTRMHADPKRGVVDPNLRLHSVNNLYVASSSVFPTSGSSTPTFTIVALTLRLVDHLKRNVLV